MDASNDGAESVDQFLARIASLSSKEGLEEAERSKRMEKEMLQARKERQARRAERARSLSPSKTGPTPSLRPIGETAPKPAQGIEPPVALTPPPQSRTLGRTGSISPRPDRTSVSGLDFSRPLPPPPTNDNPSMPSPPINANALSRSGTLSWQQRPSSRGVGSRSRPLSVASIPDSGTAAQSADLQKDAEEVSRRDIAASLGAKDPSWFRQTADRGVGSAAYRKNEMDSEAASSIASRGMRLPGMSKDSNASENRSRNEPEKPTPPSSPPKSAYALSNDQRQPSDSEETRSTRPASMLSLSPTKSPALDLPTFKPLDLSTSFTTDTPGLGRASSILSSGRPPSPTKGLGGFVESAMMKRSDSVSKRWSVQANAGLKRGDSIASTRPAHLSGGSGFTPGHNRASSRDVRVVRDGNSSPLSSSRPVSSHGSEPIPLTKGRLLPRPENEPTTSPGATSGQDTQADATTTPEVQQQKRPITPPPSESLLSRSPSKTMDPRRWSPTKASWLESALNKPPESPRFTPAKPETPAWKLNMQRAKQEQQSQSSEAAGEVSARPAVAPKPLNSPPLKDLTTFDKTGADGNAAELRSSKADSVKSVTEPLPPQDNIHASEMEQPLTGEKNEKPAVPTKRNLTPLQIGSNSVDKEESESAPFTRVKEGTVKPPQDPASPEPKMDSKPSAFKPKPQTPPKTDFRANLKSRQAASTGNNKAEPEFKAVFGKLKRTQTQNYVAPDMLKDNIAKGKAALNLTGGPQTTKRVDEFKESILQKKEAMKTGGGAIGKRSEVTSPTEKPADPIPEALARRMALQKTGTSNEKTDSPKAIDVPTKPSVSASKPQTVPTPIVQATKPPVSGLKSQSLPEKPTPVIEDRHSGLERTSTPLQATPISKAEKSDSVTAPVLPMKTVREVRNQVSQPKPETASGEAISSTDTGSQVKLPENSKLAARLNPALVGILSRSGSPKPSGDGSSSGGTVQVRDTPQLSRESTKDDGLELTHMTKARAKGPKRRAPKSDSSSKESSGAAIQKSAMSTSATPSHPVSARQPVPEMSATRPPRSFAPKPVSSELTTEVQDRKPAEAEVKRPLPFLPSAGSQQPKLTEQAGVGELSQQAGPALPPERTPKPRPVVANKSADLRKVSDSVESSKATDVPPPLKPKKSVDPKKVSNPPTPSKPAHESATFEPFTPKKLEALPDLPKFVSSPPESDGEKKPTSLSPPLPSNAPLMPSRSKLSTPKVSKPDVDSSTKPRGVPPLRANGLGLQLGSASRKLAAAPILTPPPEPEVTAAKVAVSPRKPMSPTKSASSVRPQLERFFGVLPQSGEKVEFDTHAFLSAQNKSGEKSKTLSKQIWEVSGDGKRTPMPPQQDHILFEDCMYLCVHLMQLPSGSKASEVYLWCGDEVPEAAVEDAQLFCRKVARDNSAKLEVVKQGKESSEFFQALGGIVIVRRNKSSALYMLCGRRHLGHVAFDEVDLSAESLRSELPFLISAKFGKLYLWKGNGSNQEDVGCARLIGMDMGLTGEIEEISEGEEPGSFWESFPSWSAKKAKPQPRNPERQPHDHAPRLYRIEHDRPKSSGGFWGLRASSPPKQPIRALVDEIAPFCQRDLDANHIHILDTYLELHILVGASAKKPAEFVTAIQVAQEIAVLSPSVQDRPLLPTCYVVMGDPPQTVKSVFRKWRRERSQPQEDQTYVRVEEVMRELGITL